MDAELTRRGFIGGGAALLSTVAARSYAVAVGAGKPNLKFGVLSDIHRSPAAYMAKYLKGDPKQHRPRETDLFENREIGVFSEDFKQLLLDFILLHQPDEQIDEATEAGEEQELPCCFFHRCYSLP